MVPYKVHGISQTHRTRILSQIRDGLRRTMELPALVSDELSSWVLDWLLRRDSKPSFLDLREAFGKSGLEERKLYKENLQWVNNDHVMNGWLAEIAKARISDLKSYPRIHSVPMIAGLGLPLGALPLDYFPQLYDEWASITLLSREVCMLSIIEKLTNKPDWWAKCYDEEIASRWKKEMLEVDWKAALGLWRVDCTPNMADAVISELRKKADMYEKIGLVPVMDYSAAAIKSDSIMTPDLMNALKKAVASLENIPDEHKDWHPGSNGQVLDIVHPSLWPLVYGKSRVLLDKWIGVDDALNHCGMGSTIPEHKRRKKEAAVLSQSHRFQWLPCDVAVSAEGKARIESYVNNLHPVHHAEMYPIIETFIEKSLPAWDLVYRWPSELEFQRLKAKDVYRTECHSEYCRRIGHCSDDVEDDSSEEDGEDEEDEDDMSATSEGVGEASDSDSTGKTGNDEASDSVEREQGCKVGTLSWWRETHLPKIPDVEEDSPYLASAEHVRSSGFFDSASQIQVIVKLANIHLTPEKPRYEGGSWHIEGMANEHIVSTALYYYDSENITDSYLRFRTRADREGLSGPYTCGHDHGDDFAFSEVFAIEWGRETNQDIGAVLTRQGRALFFPNVYQHCVSPFELADSTRPGHRKILALFLVDPKIPIISTSNVPPQQKHWWTEATQLFAEGHSARLPTELREQVLRDVGWPMGLEEAKEVREMLMEERSVGSRDLRNHLEHREFNFCEH